MPTFLYRIEPAREGMPDAPTAEEAALVGEHFAYLRAAHEAGVATLVGRTGTAPHLGLALLELPDEGAAEAFFARDPAVAAGVFRGRVQPFSVIFRS